MSYDYKDSQAYFGYGQDNEMTVEKLYELLLSMTFNANDLEDGSVTNGKIADFAVDYAKLAHASIGEVHIQEAAINNAMIQDAAISRAKIQEAAIGTAQIDDLTVTGAKISNAAISTAHIEDLAVDRAKIKDASIDTAKIEDLAVTTAKIADLSVDSAKIAHASIETAHIQDLAVEHAKIALAAIDTANIVDAAITNAKIEDLAVDNAKIAFAAIDTANIKDAAITSAKIGEAEITTAHIQDAAIDYAQIADLAVRTAHIQLGAITTALIAKGAIETAQIADAAITDAKIVELTAAKIKSGTIDTGQVSIAGPNGKLMIKNNRLQVFDNQTTPIERVSLGDVNNDGTIYGFRVRGADGKTVLYDHLGVYEEGITDGAITNPKISDGAVENRHIVADTITGDKLVVNSITAREIKAKTITSNEMATNTITAASAIIANAAITTATIADLAVTAAKIANATITNAKIEDAAITSAKIKDGEITNAKIKDATIEAAKIKSVDADTITTGTLTAIDIEGVTIRGSSFNVAYEASGEFTNGYTSLYSSSLNFVRSNLTGDPYGDRFVEFEYSDDGIQYRTGRSGIGSTFGHVKPYSIEYDSLNPGGTQDTSYFYVGQSREFMPDGLGGKHVEMESWRDITLKTGLGNSVKVSSGHGYGLFGALNTSYFHMDTDRNQFYMYKPLVVGAANTKLPFGSWNLALGIRNSANGAFYNYTGGAFVGLHDNGSISLGNAVAQGYGMQMRADLTSRFFESVTFDKGIVNEAWQSIVFQNGWANYTGTTFTTSAYMKDAFGFVHVKLFAQSGPQDVVMWTFPAGYRPDRNTRIVIGAYGGSSTTPDVYGTLQVNANGQVVGLKTHPGYVYGTFSFKAV